MSAIVEDCHHLLKLRASNRGINLHEMFEPDLPRLWADERAVRQVCLNLLSNAIKFTPQGGDIWLKVGWTASGGQYMSVKDTGPGIPEEEIPVVLASFGQGSNSIKSAEQGAGLGLPIAKSLVDLHGGTLHAEIQAAHRHRGGGDLPARARGGGHGADARNARAADRPRASRSSRRRRSAALSAGRCSGPAPERAKPRAARATKPRLRSRRPCLWSKANSTPEIAR